MSYLTACECQKCMELYIEEEINEDMASIYINHAAFTAMQ